MRSVSRNFYGALVAAAIAAFGLAGSVFAAVPFSESAFKAAQSAGEPILVEIHADWCSVCKAQGPVLEKLAAQPQFKNLKIFRVDFDSQKSDVKNFRATTQSTLIVYKGGHEVGRSVGDTHQDSIADLLNKTL
ncbi:MAG: thioredoxin family protein [Xanthobacteraceae bacterium]|nr:thioredoxin family protein [Xanthobacteraceae bacterium]